MKFIFTCLESFRIWFFLMFPATSFNKILVMSKGYSSDNLRAFFATSMRIFILIDSRYMKRCFVNLFELCQIYPKVNQAFAKVSADVIRAVFVTLLCLHSSHSVFCKYFAADFLGYPCGWALAICHWWADIAAFEPRAGMGHLTRTDLVEFMGAVRSPGSEHHGKKVALQIVI